MIILKTEYKKEEINLIDVFDMKMGGTGEIVLDQSYNGYYVLRTVYGLVSLYPDCGQTWTWNNEKNMCPTFKVKQCDFEISKKVKIDYL